MGDGAMVGGRVLIVEDAAGQGEILREYLQALRVDVAVAQSPAAAIRHLRRQPVHAVLCALGPPGGGGTAVVRALRSGGWPTPVILVAGDGEAPRGTEWRAAGAFDILRTPVERGALVAALRRALHRSGRTGTPPSAPGAPAVTGDQLVGTSAAMADLRGQIAKVAAVGTSVCLYGESGTGKELVARAIHYTGPRAGYPLVVLDCPAVPVGLMESELFGHVKGAFTSATSDRPGVFQLAEGGTLVLDEIGEIPLSLQATFLRVLQGREVRPVGGRHPIPVNVRLIAATNRDLRTLVRAGQFREDLFYRLEGIPITLPPLRARPGDIPLLVDHFLAQVNRTSPKQIRGVRPRVLERLCRYPWPGNVRELENAIARAAVLADRDVLDLADFPQILPPAGASPTRRNGSGAGRHQAGGEGESANPACSRPHAYTN
jgi:two-component system, NtrC family, response regulator AtoC